MTAELPRPALLSQALPLRSLPVLFQVEKTPFRT
jgi:hypothetical protein